MREPRRDEENSKMRLGVKYSIHIPRLLHCFVSREYYFGSREDISSLFFLDPQFSLSLSLNFIHDKIANYW